MKKLLVVEDNIAYSNAAERYLTSQDYSVTLAQDYTTAMDGLRDYSLDGMVIDCFFPKSTGSGDIVLGKGLIAHLAADDPRERKIVEGLELVGQYVDLEDHEMRKYARFVIGNSRYEDISKNPIVIAIQKISMLGKDAVTLLTKNAIGMIYRESQTQPDYYGALLKAIEESEANQPLGLLIAQRAAELRLPFVLATSTYHHDLLTQPVQDYASQRGWRLVDCMPNGENGKASPVYWERVRSELETQLQKKDI